MDRISNKRVAIAAGVALGLSFAALALTARPARAQGDTTASVRVGESAAGNAVADAVRSAAGAQVALIPASAFRSGVAVPSAAGGDQLASLLDPPSDAIVLLSLTGAQLKDALERSVRYGAKGFAGFLQVSGIKVSVDPARADGARIVSLSVGGQPVNPATKYKVATTKPLANGASGYFQIWSKADVAGDAQKTLAEALRAWAAGQGGSVTLSTDGRIGIKS